MKPTENNTIDDKLKQGCLFPLYAMALAVVLSLIVIFMLNCGGAKSQETIDNEQLDEMVQYHRSQGRDIIVFE